MHYTSTYDSPIGEMLIAADDVGVVGAWFKGGKYYARGLDKDSAPRETPAIIEFKRWLDVYFNGDRPDFEPPVHMVGTPFQIEVWEILREIPYGDTVTYNDIAKKLAARRGLSRMSAQAVGTAVGKNRVNIVVPCHRVVGANGSLCGYAGGMDKKIALLKIESAFKPEFFVPKRGTAL